MVGIKLHLSLMEPIKAAVCGVNPAPAPGNRRFLGVGVVFARRSPPHKQKPCQRDLRNELYIMEIRLELAKVNMPFLRNGLEKPHTVFTFSLDVMY
jgi:hypothetical protein